MVSGPSEEKHFSHGSHRDHRECMAIKSFFSNLGMYIKQAIQARRILSSRGSYRVHKAASWVLRSHQSRCIQRFELWLSCCKNSDQVRHYRPCSLWSYSQTLGTDEGETTIAQILLTLFWTFALCSGPNQCLVSALIERLVRGCCVILRAPVRGA